MMRLIHLWVYGDDEDTPVVIIDPPDNLLPLLRAWCVLDTQLSETGEEPGGWTGISEWLKARGVQVVEPQAINLDDYDPSRKEGESRLDDQICNDGDHMHGLGPGGHGR
jgi:hypothetical protein